MENNVTKSFWQRPEGKTGMLVLIGLIAGAGFLLFTALPFILMLLQNTIYALAMGVVLFVAVYILCDKKFRVRISALYQIAMKWFTGWVVQLDPIAIIEGYLETLQESLEKMSTQLDLLKGQESKLSTKITNNAAQVQNSLKKASFAKEKMLKTDESDSEFLELKGLAVIEGNKASRLDNSNQKLQEVLFKIANLRKTLEKMHFSARMVLTDMTDEVKIKKEEREAVLKGYSAFKSAMKVLNGNKDEKAMFDEGMEFIAMDLGNKVGEIERFMENSGSMLTSMDIENEMFSNKGLQMIEDWEKGADKLVIALPKGTTTTSSLKADLRIPEMAVNSGTKTNKYINLNK